MEHVKKEKPRHLGRGLQSLLGPITAVSVHAEGARSPAGISGKYPPDKELTSGLGEISISAILSNPYQPRTTWDSAELQSLADSIKTNGVIQPVVVRAVDGKYQLIAGERRLRACQLAGLESIPAIVRTVTDSEMLELALVENIHRADLNPVERAQAYQKYLSEFSLSQAEAATRLGEDRSVIANHIRLLELPGDIKRMLVERQLTMGHARAILALPTDELRRKLANRAMAGRLSVRDVERLVRSYTEADGTKKKAPEAKAAHIIDLENRLSRTLGTKVTIEARKGGRRGKVVVEFYSMDDFDRICQTMGISSVEEM
ncbi:MAG TPA: ParB/RepB/Spo0J family partition protein [Sedimentisphaerales bacterium]|nr:ParB/RepB/Spo0J family partition protein [Sedimentisphaerales bacterium]